MSFDVIRAAIETTISNGWTTTPIAYDNVPFTPVSGTSWIEVVVIDGTTIRIGLGTPGEYRSSGVLAIGIYTPVGIGTSTGRQYAESIAALFRSQVISGVVFRDTSIKRVGHIPQSNWFKYSVMIPFYYDQQSTP